jgi:hypothetical protein
VILDSVRRLELGMRSASSPRGLPSPPDVVLAKENKRECSKQQLDQLLVYIKQAVVRYFCNNVLGVRKKSTRSCFVMSPDSISILDALKGLSENASKIIDHVTENYLPPSTYKEVNIAQSACAKTFSSSIYPLKNSRSGFLTLWPRLLT